MGRPPRTPADRQQMKEIGQRLRWVREALSAISKKRVTQTELASRIGLHQTAWSLYERGERMPDQFEAVRIVAKLRLSMDYLMEGSLEGLDLDLAIQIAARHPELVLPTHKGSGKGTDQK